MDTACVIKLPKPLLCTREEGDPWEPFGMQPAVHSVMFDDGTVFDTVNGWRTRKVCVHCKGTGRND